ncbi:MAG: hypothetical protein IPH94_16910 [Saprospiraceae bacterium]|nr:hypothetical protein [Saprospiraceae bacterium]
MTDRHQESIEKYLLGQMDTTEKAAFEDRLKSDMELQKEWAGLSFGHNKSESCGFGNGKEPLSSH